MNSIVKKSPLSYTAFHLSLDQTIKIPIIMKKYGLHRVTPSSLLFTLLLTLGLNGCNDSVPLEKVVSENLAGIDHDAIPLWLSNCALCHGATGGGNVDVSAPAVTGLQAWYLERQLRHFKNGIRGTHAQDTTGGQMAKAIKNLSEAELDGLTELMTLLPSTAAQTFSSGDEARGKDYHNNLCSACHGSDGKGNEALQAPSLAGLNDWYIVNQYEKFRLGIRGSHPEDHYGAQMVRFSPAVKDAEVVRDIAYYLTTLPIDAAQ